MDRLNLENQLDEATKELIVNMEKELEEKASEIKSKDKELNDLKNQLVYLQGQILATRKSLLAVSHFLERPQGCKFFMVKLMK